MATDSVRLPGLIDRYASALFDLAGALRVGSVVERDLLALRSMVEDSSDLRRFLASPLLSQDQQKAVLNALMDKARFGDLTKRFILVVARNRRLFALPQMITRYFALQSAARNELVAEVTSAAALSDKQKKSIHSALKKAAGSDVRIVPHVDPALLGGLVIKLGSRLFDSSLSGKLSNLKLVMKGKA